MGRAESRGDVGRWHHDYLPVGMLDDGMRDTPQQQRLQSGQAACSDQDRVRPDRVGLGENGLGDVPLLDAYG